MDNSQETHIFRPSKNLRIICGVLLVLTLLFLLSALMPIFGTLTGAGTTSPFDSSLMNTLIAILDLVLMGWLIDFVFVYKLVATQEGIWSYNFGTRFYSWESLQEIRSGNKSWQSSSWGIATSDSSESEANTLQEILAKIFMESNYIRLDFLEDMPKTFHEYHHNTEDFMQTDLGQVLLQHAPHLFEDSSGSEAVPDDKIHESTSQEPQMSRKDHG